MPGAPLQLNADWDGFGEKGRPVLVLLHGFSTRRESWEIVRDGLREIGPTLAVDLIGHGRSPAPPEPEPYRMEACLDQLEALLEALGIGAAWWVGYSMGGRVALQVAAHKPDLVEGLVIESATAGIEEPALRHDRALADEALAETILAEGVEAFVTKWLAQPLFEGFRKLPPEQQSLQRELRSGSSAKALANSLRGMGTGTMTPVWSHLDGSKIPALILAGENDPKFVEIAGALSTTFSECTLEIIPGAGHTTHVESPSQYLSAVSRFFQIKRPRPF